MGMHNNVASLIQKGDKSKSAIAKAFNSAVEVVAKANSTKSKKKDKK